MLARLILEVYSVSHYKWCVKVLFIKLRRGALLTGRPGCYLSYFWVFIIGVLSQHYLVNLKRNMLLVGHFSH